MLPSKGSPNVPKKLNWKVNLLKNIYGWSALYRAKYFLAFRPPKTLVNPATYLFAPPLFCFFLHRPTHIFSPSPSFFLSPRVVTQIPLLLSLRRCPMGDKAKQRRMSGVVKKRGKEFTPPFPFFSFLSLVCLFFLTRSRKRRKREGTTTKKEDFMKPCLSFLFLKNPAFLLRQ